MDAFKDIDPQLSSGPLCFLKYTTVLDPFRNRLTLFFLLFFRFYNLLWLWNLWHFVKLINLKKFNFLFIFAAFKVSLHTGWFSHFWLCALIGCRIFIWEKSLKKFKSIGLFGTTTLAKPTLIFALVFLTFETRVEFFSKFNSFRPESLWRWEFDLSLLRFHIFEF